LLFLRATYARELFDTARIFTGGEQAREPFSARILRMKLAIFGTVVLAIATFVGCTEVRTADTTGIVTLELSPEGDLEVGFKLPNTTVRQRFRGESSTVFPARSKSMREEIDGAVWTGLRYEGADVKDGEIVEVLARYDAVRRVYRVRMDSTMPFVLRAKFDAKLDGAADGETVDVPCAAGKRAFEVEAATRGDGVVFHRENVMRDGSSCGTDLTSVLRIAARDMAAVSDAVSGRRELRCATIVVPFAA
jgi:hypothetical protein